MRYGTVYLRAPKSCLLANLIYRTESKTSRQSNLTKGRIAAAHWRQSLNLLYNGRPSPSKFSLPMGDLGLTSNAWFLGRPESTPHAVSRSVQPFLQGSRSWQADRPRYTPSVTIGRIYAVPRCGLKRKKYEKNLKHRYGSEDTLWVKVHGVDPFYGLRRL